MIPDYKDDIFNLDEMGLFYGLLPSKIFAVKGSKLRTGKNRKIKISLLVGANIVEIDLLCLSVHRELNSTKNMLLGSEFTRVPVRTVFHTRVHYHRDSFLQHLLSNMGCHS
jgi:hypothetical protein